MLAKPNTLITGYAFYTASGVGFKPAAVTVDVSRKGDPTNLIKTGVAATVISNVNTGWVWYSLVAADAVNADDYLFTFKTTDSVDQKHLPALWVSSQAWVHSAQDVWDVSRIGTMLANSFGELLKALVLGSDGRVLISANAHTSGVTVANLTDKTGFALTSGERTAIANEVENQIINEGDSERVIDAIVQAVNNANPSLSGLTLSAIATAVKTSMEAGGSSLALVKARTDLITNDPATATALQNVLTSLAGSLAELQGAGWTEEDSLKAISTAIGVLPAPDYTGVMDKINEIPGAVWAHNVGTSAEPVYEVGQAGRGEAMLQRTPYDAPLIPVPNVTDPPRVPLQFVGNPHNAEKPGTKILVEFSYDGPVQINGFTDDDRKKTVFTEEDGTATVQVFPSSMLQAAGIVPSTYKITWPAAAAAGDHVVTMTIPDGGANFDVTP